MPAQELPQVLDALRTTLVPGGVFFASNPRGENQEGWQGERYGAFRLLKQAEVTGLLEEGGLVQGVRAQTPEGELEVRADLVIGADGRASTVRAHSKLVVEKLGAPMDVLWFRLSKQDGDPEESTGHFATGRILIMISRREHWQMGYVIPKGSLEELRTPGLDAFRASIGELASFAANRVHEIASWDDVKPLTVAVDRLRQWHQPGLLCIGDAAHAMSPIGGVGINLAIQDAVACANLLTALLREGRLTDRALAAVQARRLLPTRITQWLQVAVQNRLITRVLAGTETLAPPLAARIISRTPLLQRIPAWIVGMGIRPEHIETAAATGEPQVRGPDDPH